MPTTPPSRRPPGREARASVPPDTPPPATSASPPVQPSARVLALPALLAIVVGSASLLTAHPVLQASFLGASGALLVWSAALFAVTRRRPRDLAIRVVVRPQHWVQACAQLTLILYWASHNPIVVAFLPFIVVQLVFAFAVDSLLTWSRHDTYTLGFGPLPIIFSINLFLLFKPDWFFWQFILVAIGFLAKELIRWNKDGRSAHIFNPSSFPLSVFSLGLILTATTDVTFGNVIANTIFDTPHIFLAVFLVSLPGQILFGVARITIAAVVTMVAISLAYFAATGTYLFFDAYIPPAVFLGMHLLVTDPSTSPRSVTGRIAFGVLYAAITTVLFVILEHFGQPTFYDKLLPIPLLNLSILALDRFAGRVRLPARRAAERGEVARPIRTNVLITGAWAAIFAILFATHTVGDTHPGQYLPFWQEACGTGNTRACTYAARLTIVYCQRGSGWACNSVGILRRRLGADASAEFARSCELGYAPGCENAKQTAAAVGALVSSHPALPDLPIVLSGTKPTLEERNPRRLLALACDQGWPGACGGWTAGPP